MSLFYVIIFFHVCPERIEEIDLLFTAVTGIQTAAKVVVKAIVNTQKV